MSEHTDKLRALAEQARPLQTQLAEIAAKQCEAANEAALELIKAAFPDTKIEEVRTLANITPTNEILETTGRYIKAVQTAGIKPSRIVVDKARFVIQILR